MNDVRSHHEEASGLHHRKHPLVNHAQDTMGSRAHMLVPWHASLVPNKAVTRSVIHKVKSCKDSAGAASLQKGM